MILTMILIFIVSSLVSFSIMYLIHKFKMMKDNGELSDNSKYVDSYEIRKREQMEIARKKKLEEDKLNQQNNDNIM